MNKFNRSIAQLYHSPQKSEASLWKNAFFVFDTSSLLYLYEYSDNTKSNILSNLGQHLKDRLWIPHHVAYEYLKNRERVIKNPISNKDKYGGLITGHISDVERKINSIIKNNTEFHDKTKKRDKHPYVNEDIIKKFKIKSEGYLESFKEFSKQVEDEILIRKDETDALLKDDMVLNFIESSFYVGDEYDIDNIFEIIKESNFRFENKIAPGWEDCNEKLGIQRVADLIIWKQIIDFSKENNKPIILITNDIKDDWCHSKKRSNKKSIIRPRRELIQEIKNKASTDFWMYTFEQFLFESKDYLGTNIKKEALVEVSELSQHRNYFILNTNLSTGIIDHENMMSEHIAAAHSYHWKNKIFKISPDDIIFLYKNGEGITAMGVPSSDVYTRSCHGNSKYKERYVKLYNFCNLECNPISASEMKNITGKNHRLMTTMVRINNTEGSRLFKNAENRCCNEDT